MKLSALSVLLLLAGVLGYTAPPAAVKQAPKKPTAAVAPKAAPKSAATKSGYNSRYNRRYTATRRWTPPPRPVGPQAPSPERYKEVQQALVERGYLAGEPTGEWKQDSIDALKRFQQDQKLDSNGKLDSLSIIALGLGPKRTTAAAAAPAPAEAPKVQQPQ